MNREHLYEPFEVIYKKLDECPKAAHKHLFFELVYVLSGTGMQCINNNKFQYQADQMFLITPEDCHSFEIETTTEFFFYASVMYISALTIFTRKISEEWNIY